jgi:hypothetical protein
MSDWLAFVTLLVVHLGFAALLGAFARQAKSVPNRFAVVLAVFAYFLSSLVLPLAWLPKLAVWLLSAGLFVFFAKWNATGIWLARLAWFYAGFAMLLILAWSALQGWISPVLSLGAAAACAAVMAWRRGVNSAA